VPELARFFGIIIRMYAEAGGPHHRPFMPTTKRRLRSIRSTQSTLLPDRFRARSSALLKPGQRYTERSSWRIGTLAAGTLAR
jgi:hypothetical protein